MSRDAIHVARVKPLIPAVIAIKLNSNSKVDIEIAACQVAQITTSSCENGIVVIDIIITHGGLKDISKRVKALCEHKKIEAVLLYTAKQVAETEQEYKGFVADMRDWHGLNVLCYR